MHKEHHSRYVTPYLPIFMASDGTYRVIYHCLSVIHQGEEEAFCAHVVVSLIRHCAVCSVLLHRRYLQSAKPDCSGLIK